MLGPESQLQPGMGHSGNQKFAAHFGRAQTILGTARAGPASPGLIGSIRSLIFAGITYEGPEGVRNFSRHRSARVRCFTGGKFALATSSITMNPANCFMRRICHRTEMPRYLHWRTAENFAPKSRAARSISCRVKRVKRIVGKKYVIDVI